MKLLAEITEKSLGVEASREILETEYLLRKSARAILLNDKNEISIQFVGRLGYYKLPGGGVEVGETEREALHREILEEVGCECTIEDEIGITIEYRNHQRLLHISYGYIARVKGVVGEPSYEQGEIDDEYKSLWVPLEEILELVSKHTPRENLNGQFIVERELVFLKEAIRILNSK